MGWKSTKTLTPEKARVLLINRIMEASNDELGLALEALGYGDKTELKYYGCNFSIEENPNEEF